MKKNILIISRAFYPQNSPRSFRTTELVKEFSRLGHKVTLLIPDDGNNDKHTAFGKEFGLNIKYLGKQQYGVIDFRKGNSFTKLIKRVLRRVLVQLVEYPNVEWTFKVKKALQYEKNYDLLISIAAPHSIHWGVACALNKKKPLTKLWVADCGDPFMGVTTDTFRKPFYFKYIEKYWCRKVDFITVPFKGAIEGYYKEFHNKIKVIPQGIDFKELEFDPQDYRPNKKPTFAYAGGLIPGVRDPKALIRYLLSKGIDFKFILYTRSKSMIAPILKEAGDKIEIKDYIPRNKLISFLGKMDFLINLNNSVSTQLPSKLIDYYLTKRPVLSIDSNHFEKKIIDEFLRGDYSHKVNFDNPQQYNIKNVCQQFLTL